jgi:hypothetical protein
MNQTSANRDSLGILNHSKSHSASRKPDHDELATESVSHNDSMRTGELSSEISEDDIHSVAEHELELEDAGQSRGRRNAGIGSEELGLPKNNLQLSAERAGFGKEAAQRNMEAAQRQRRGAIDLGNRVRKLQEEPAVPSDCEDLKNSRGVLQQGLRSLCIEIANFQTGYHNKNEMMALKTDEKIDNWLRAAESLHGEQEEFQRMANAYKRGMLNDITLATRVLASHPKWGVGTDEGPKPLVGPKEILLPEQYMQPAFGHDSFHNKISQWGTGMEPTVPLSRHLGLPGSLKPNHVDRRGGQLGSLRVTNLHDLNTDELEFLNERGDFLTNNRVQTGSRVQTGGAYLSAENLNKHVQAGRQQERSGLRVGALTAGDDSESQSDYSEEWDDLSEHS